MFLLGYVLQKTDANGLAIQLFHRATQLFPGEAAMWHNIGKCYHDVQDDKRAEEFFRKALKVKPNFASSLEGLSMVNIEKAEWGLAIEYANRALAEEDLLEARVNRGMAYLALGRWVEGWRDYNANIGVNSNREEIKYGQEPRWDGTKGLDVVVYGEQGIGDEISFSSCIPDLIRDAKSVTIETDVRLERLFKRSFPQCEVYGTRYKKTSPAWRAAKKYDARVAIGRLCEIYRTKDEDFPDGKYLVPNPVMALQWRALLDSLGTKPKIGLAWHGGLPHTGRKRRSVTLDTLAPLFKYDADWVSLQYVGTEDIKPAEEKYGVKIHEWEWGNKVPDFDQTVALVSELDLVISVCTSVVHAAGALGKECWVMVPQVPMWRYMSKGDFPWAKSIKLFRQKGAEWPVHLMLGQLRDKFGDHLRNGRRESEELQAAA